MVIKIAMFIQVKEIRIDMNIYIAQKFICQGCLQFWCWSKSINNLQTKRLKTQRTMNESIFLFLWIIFFTFKYLDVFLMFEWTVCIHRIKNILKQKHQLWNLTSVFSMAANKLSGSDQWFNQKSAPKNNNKCTNRNSLLCLHFPLPKKRRWPWHV